MYAFRLIFLPRSTATGFLANKNALVLSIFRYYSPSSSPSLSPSGPASEKCPPSLPFSYLVNTSANSAAKKKKVNFTSPDKRDLVLGLLRDYGFDDTHISALATRFPSLFLSNPDKIIRPKLDFFHNLFGLSSSSRLPSFIVSFPYCLRFSLRYRIIPYRVFLKSVLLDDSKVAIALTKNPRIFTRDVSCYFAPNVKLLSQVGAPLSVVSYALMRTPAIFNRKPATYKAEVEDVIKMGFRPSKLSFILALYTTNSMPKSLWYCKVKLYKSWSWSDDEISLAFRKDPTCMLWTEKKISRSMDFLVNKMGFLTSSIAKCPTILAYSFERRIIPRSTIYRFLQLKGLMDRKIGLNTLIILSEKQFLDKFVTPYKEQVPEVLKVYQGKLGIVEVGFGPEDIARVSQS